MALIIFPGEPKHGFGILFVVGLLTSLHCIAMCGGINLSQCVSYKFGNDENARFSKLRPSILYNGGRVISYTIIGGIVGTMGSVVSFQGLQKVLWQFCPVHYDDHGS